MSRNDKGAYFDRFIAPLASTSAQFGSSRATRVALAGVTR